MAPTEESPLGSLRGWRLAAAAAGVFLWPLLTALVGAGLGGSNQNDQVAGAVAGFLLGTLIASGVTRILRNTGRGNA